MLPILTEVTPAPNRWVDFMGFCRTQLPKVLFLFGAYVFLLAVIGFQNVPYMDDSTRRLLGITNWGTADGRWGSELVARLINAGTPLVDMGLTTFVLTGLILAAASTMLIWALIGDQANWLTWILAVLFGLNPWTLSAFAYRFDGPLIALSVLAAVSSVFCWRLTPRWQIFWFAVVTLVTANFYQQLIGLILILQLTRVLLDWLQQATRIGAALKQLLPGIAGLVIGMVGYMAQTQLVGTYRSEWFDIRNPFGSFARNLYGFLRVFLLENALSWLVVTVLVLMVFSYYVFRITRRQALPVLAVMVGYGIIIVLASGGVLLFATSNYIADETRFRFPLAMSIALLAIAASPSVSRLGLNDGVGGNANPAGLRWASRLILVAFAYLWLLPTFIFAGVLAEQRDSLRLQASLIFSDIFSTYRPGDIVVYDPNVFTDSLYARRVAQRFPIFASPYYVGHLNVPRMHVEERLIEMLGLGGPRDVLWPTAEVPDTCDFRPADAAVIAAGPRWEVWRSQPEVVCVTFPAIANVVVNTPELQAIELDLPRVPAVTELSTAQIPQLEMALWSKANPADIQHLNPTELINGVATFMAVPPLAGWTPDQFADDQIVLVAHFFYQDEFLFQQIWPVDSN